MKYYLYHWIPTGMIGTTLYPLNRLKEVLPEAYSKNINKYAWRPHVLEWRVPTLDCYWNDVIHLIAIHPKVAKQALEEAGYKEDEDYTVSCFEIDPSMLEPEKTTVCLYTEEPTTGGHFKESDFVPFNVQDMEKYAVIPQRTKDYYKKCVKDNKIPLSFPWVPHIFYKGSINTEGLNIVHS